MTDPMHTEPAASVRWWEGAVIYQIYPRSFVDSNGDGIGDLDGIRSRLDYLRGADGALDVDAIWLSPIYPSPLADVGYDISDYTGIAPEYGDLDAFDRLVTACHERGLRVLLDLVPCHTSDQHPWFLESRSSRDNPKRSWYLWADPAPGSGPPTNWEGAFGGSVWEWDDATGQYYLHSFYPEQPDLNWRNPDVAAAIAEVMRFWFRRGVDGFRVDAIFAAIKDDRLRDDPPGHRGSVIPGLGARTGLEPLWSLHRPEVHDVVRHLRRVADEFPGRVLVGEAYVPVEQLVTYLGHGVDDEFQLCFNFELLLSPWTHRDLTLAIERSEALHPPHAVPTYAFGNHDQSRHATRWAPERARLAAFLLLTLRGVAVMYAGEEIGMVDADPAILPDPPFDRAGRDGYRTPMQWSPEPNGGFTSGTPWLPLVDPHTRNVAGQSSDPGSLLRLYRRLIDARQRSPALGAGEHRSIFGVAADVLAWVRQARDERILCLANLGEQARHCDLRRLRAEGTRSGIVVVGTSTRDGEVALDGLTLEPLEGIALRI